MYQALIRVTDNYREVAHSYTFESKNERAEFVKDPAVFWYFFPDGDEFNWRKGGAWSARNEPDDTEYTEPDSDEDRW